MYYEMKNITDTTLLLSYRKFVETLYAYELIEKPFPKDEVAKCRKIEVEILRRMKITP